MESDTRIAGIRHAQDIRFELNSSTGLPLADVLSAQTVAHAIESQDLDYRERFFLPTSRCGLFYRRFWLMISPARRQ
jgi:hypothetical protein